MISKDKQNELVERMQRLHIQEGEIAEKFILSSGPGGQKVNKTASTVYLKHLPTGIEIKCGKDRSREINRFLARRKLCDRIEKEKLGMKTQKDIKIEKIKKQKKRRTRKNIRKNNSPNEL